MADDLEFARIYIDKQIKAGNMKKPPKLPPPSTTKPDPTPSPTPVTQTVEPAPTSEITIVKPTKIPETTTVKSTLKKSDPTDHKGEIGRDPTKAKTSAEETDPERKARLEKRERIAARAGLSGLMELKGDLRKIKSFNGGNFAINGDADVDFTI